MEMMLALAQVTEENRIREENVYIIDKFRVKCTVMVTYCGEKKKIS